MVTKIQKWGNSLGLRIPKSFAEEAEVGPGTPVDLSVVDGGLVVRPITRKKYRLADLVRKISTRNRHREIRTGERVGRESW